MGAALALFAGVTGALAGCSSPEEIAEKTGVVAEARAAVGPDGSTAAATASAAGGGGEAFTDKAEREGGSREFAYTWPAAVSAIPALAAELASERDTLLAEQKAEWQDSIAEFAGEDCTACTTRSFEKTWEVVADLPRFLSLSASFYAYTGGAHGNGAYGALVWDRKAGAGFDPKAMFRSPAALQDALGAPWCAALKRERTQRLGAEYAEDGFFTCPPLADLTVLVGSSNEQNFNRIGLIAAPYVAGSYAEGTYEVTLPVTKAVLEAVKPEYRSAFALSK